MVKMTGKYAISILMLSMAALLLGCDNQSTLPASADASVQADPDATTAWPTHLDNGSLKQVTKHQKDLQRNPQLVLISYFPDNEMPDWDIEPLGVKQASVKQVEQLLATGKWVGVDVRKDNDLLATGTIPGARHHEYKFERAKYNGKTQLTEQSAKALVAEYQGIILFCNGPKCPRSYNAVVAVVQQWGVDPKKVRWYRLGAPSWEKTILVLPKE